MPTPDPSASLSPFEAWMVDAALRGDTLATGLGVELAVIGIVVVFLLAILAVQVYRP